MINHTPPPRHNRDYFSRPIQSDRLRQDYGNTRLGEPVPTVDGRFWRGFLLAVPASLLLWAAIFHVHL